MNTNLKTYCISLMVVFLYLSSILPLSSAASSTILGSRYQIPPEERNTAANLTQAIANYSLSSGFTTYSWYGSETTRPNIFFAAQGNGHPYSIVFYTGHGDKSYYYNSNDTYPEQWWLIIDNSGNYAYDRDIFQESEDTAGNVRFVLLWSCYTGDVIGGTYPSGFSYGMPYAWLHTTSLSSDGYVYPDNKSRAFIGFQGPAPMLMLFLGGVQYAGYKFLLNFYNATLLRELSIIYALDYAAFAVWGPSCTPFTNCMLYTGFTLGDEYRKLMVYGDGNMEIGPKLAMKTNTSGYFYVPNVATDLLKIEMLFNNQNITGDQIGGTSPYTTITAYPDKNVDIRDTGFISQKYGLVEGQSGWDYMADVLPDRKIDVRDLATVTKNFGKSGTYITDLTGVTITFNTGQTISPDSYGCVTIPQGATSFTVKRNATPIGAMVIFW